MNFFNSKHKRGFTFIEIVVVIGVIGLALPAFFAIIFTIARAQTKVQHLTEVKKQADSAVSVMQTTLRNDVDGIYENDANGLKIPKECNTFGSNTTTDDVYFHTVDDEYVRFYTNPDSLLARSIDGATDELLTSNTIKIVGEDYANADIAISCQDAGSDTPLVSIEFWAGYKKNAAVPTRPEDQAKLKYRFSTKLRNYSQ